MDCGGHGARSYSGWYQMYPSAAVGVSNHVQAGDHMIGTVTYDGGGRFMLRLDDTTGHWSQVVEATSYRSRRATAEVISEASSGPLANFGTVHFGAITVDGQPLARARPERIDMATAAHQRAATGWLGEGGNFDVSWQHG